ncbi:hypothetical protein B0H16DRAFT_1817220 [Mycena metata]|uniref:F-box domain-containing protein n=1 Tax=Mycena metata TaxID=1033252 RepID=A0AAD7KAZ9_9AGAR|nr:hypothetical protein B0H16DRAFT_1817220 [Mycena metata]
MLFSGESESSCCPRCGFPEPAPLTAVATQSPCSEFLRSNHLPTDAILSNVRREIAIAENGVEEIDQQVCGLKHVLDGLESRRRELQNFVATHKQVLAPIRTLPSEILYEIFLQYVKHRQAGAWLLARVCRSWRETAISSPRLWNQIWIQTSSFGASISGATIKSMLSLQLQRSAQAPLYISLAQDRRLRETQKVAILEALFLAAHHWHEVCLDLQLEASNLGGLFLRLVANELPASFPQLRRLVLYTNFFLEESTLSGVFRHLPLLEELSYFTGSPGGLFRPAPSLGLQGVALGQIKKLLIVGQRSRHNLSDMLGLLHMAPNLVELELKNYVLVDGPGDGARIVHLPNLVSVTMSEIDDSFLRYIASPTLQRLTIKSAPRSRSDPIAGQAPILSFLSQPGLFLTSLELRPVLQSTERLLDILAHTPHLSTLKLYFPDFVDRLFVDALACGPGERDLVPHLVFLEIEGMFRRCGCDPLVDMLRSRSNPGPLRAVTIYGNRAVQRMPNLDGVEITLS